MAIILKTQKQEVSLKKNDRTRDLYRSGLFDGGLPGIVYNEQNR